MSFQLVYTSAPVLLDSPGSGYGTVARSEDIPRRLAQKLENISIYREQAASLITGTQYSYQIIEHEGAAYHVLTAVSLAGADYSGRVCHIAHHIALTPEEVIAMRNNAMRPTPAGIILALERSAFWYKQWQGEPRTLSGEPRLSASALPDASRQATWKRLTGHKSNARAFFTPPYDRDCLCLVPEQTDSGTILLLINESDWLAASRGWGKTFTTHAADSDSFSFTRRIFATAASPLVAKAEQSGKAILDISPDLILPEKEIAASAEEFSTLQHPVSSNTPLPSPEPDLAAPNPPSPYRYCESSDEDTYELPPKRINWLRVSGLVLGVGILVAGGIIIHAGMPGKHPMGLVWEDGERGTADVAPSGTSAPGSLKNMVARLRALCRAPYDATAAQLTLDQLAAQARQLPFPDSPDASAFLACVSSLREAGNLSSDYAAELISLMQFARQFHLSEHQLGRFFMYQATFARHPDEAWFKALDDEYPRWAFIFSRFPDMITWLHRDFGRYMDPILRRFSSTPPPNTSPRWVQGIIRPNLPLPAWLLDSCPAPAEAAQADESHEDIADALPSVQPPENTSAMGQRPYALIAGQSPASPQETGQDTLSQRDANRSGTGQEDAMVRDMLLAAVEHPITQGELIIAHGAGELNKPLRLFLDAEHHTLKTGHCTDGNTETFSISLIGSDGTAAPDFCLELRFESGQLRDIVFNGGSPQIVCIPLPTRDQVLHPTILAQPLEITLTVDWAGVEPPSLPLNRFKLYAGPNRKNEVRFGLQPMPGIAPEDAYQLPDIELSPRTESPVCIPSIGYVCQFAPITGTRIGSNRYTIDFRTIPNQHKEFDILPKVSCSINFRDFLVRQLSELSRSFPLKDGQSIPLADLFFAAQEFQLGRHSKTQPDQLARLYINATASIEAVSAYRFFENHIGTQFLALHGDKNKVMEMFSSPLKARFVQNRIETLLSDTLMRRFGSYFRECLCDSPAIRLTLRLKNIDVAEDVLIWQFEPVLPDSAADRQSPAAEALPEAEAGKTPLRGTAEESRPEAQENEPLPEAQSRGSRPKATE